LINQAVGDALSDLLLVDAILHIEGMTIQDWNNMYTDLPSRQLKVQVRDRSLIVVNDNETICLQPAAVQTALDAAMTEFKGRAFVRPSGTEDVVRIYAEAADRQAADGLAAAAAAIVYRLCDGVGEAPPVFPASRM
jgi:phosphoacetylglucosamine mutase